MPAFTPPTVSQSLDPGDRLFCRYHLQVGQSVLLRDGTYETTVFPWIGELEGLTEGVEYFLGGRTYEITDATADALEADGYTTDRTAGYGEGGFGEGGFGQ